MAAPTNGYSSPSHGSGRKGPYPHVDDLTSVSVDLDPHTPLRKVLETGDVHMRQALTYSDFGRKDLALREYIKAFTIAVENIPKHKDYPSVKNDRSELGRLYVALKGNITKHSGRFDRIKAEIREDNQRSGAQSRKTASDALLMNLPDVPTTVPNRHKANGVNGVHGAAFKQSNTTSASDSQTRSRNGSASSPQRTKPSVQPKPPALHGNAITSPLNGGTQDLASRFAKLRVNQDAPLGAHAYDSAKPAGPRDMPLPTRPHVNSSVPTMPKMPDAIYSPARGTVTSEVADLPSSTPRGMFSRTNSIASAAPSSARNSIDIGARPTTTETSALAYTSSSGSTATPASPRIQIPSGTLITPEQLRNYMQKGASVVRLLLIDVRSRDEFDDGHIMSQNTICIEPSVLTRGHVSADEIEDSMGIAPDEEMRAFENRAKFDLVVIYDEDSILLPERPQADDQATALFTLYQGLDQFNYGRELRNKPKLLRGGVEAWSDLFGRHSLQESKTSAAVKDGQTRTNLSRFRPGYTNRRRARAQTKALRPDEIKEFEKKIKEDEAAAKSPQDFVRSTTDFLRRFPSASEIQQSMTAPAVATPAQFETDLPPAPPARPAPSVPRTSYSGLSSKTSASDGVPGKAALTEAPARDRPTGLINPRNNCFANSAIQVVLASPGFATELARKEWADQWKPAAPTPQLMSRILGNLIEWLAGRQFDSMQPTTFMKYCLSIHKGYPLNQSESLLKFGDGNQHDSSEFLLDFVFSQLDNETNRSHNTALINYSHPGEDFKKIDKEKARALPLTDLALEAWRRYTSAHDSIMTVYWGVLLADRNMCQTCGDSVDSFGYSNYLDLGITGSNNDSYLNLRELLDEQYNTKEIRRADGGTGYECGSEIGECHMSKEAFTKLARLPPLLAIRFKRWDHSGAKILRKIRFDVENLDLGRYSLDYSNSHNADKVDGFGREHLYDLYAVITHGGSSANGGHYVAHVKDNSDKDGVRWFICNDKDVYRRVVGSRTNTPLERDWYDCANKFTPFVIFYKRKDIPWSYAKASAGLK
ncbi:putative USP domain-containing protein [Seiridium unicorne]|uniref:ubiquitinyl hydrolase 1 n=1 Tax=Seiridium unicorne TaxID=138068 RepID=A0ABR2UKH4_9PEZI